MPHDPQQYPKESVGTHKPELFWRNPFMMNLRIQGDKMKLLKDLIDINDYHEWKDDFCQDIDSSVRWYRTVVQLGSGDASNTCADGVNGQLLITNDDADNDRVELTTMCECWKLVANYPLYAEIRFQISDVLQSDFWFGLITSHSYWAATPDDAIIFSKQDGDANLDFITRTNAAQTLTDTTYDLINATWIRAGFHWDGYDTVRYFVINDVDFPQTINQTGNHTANICQDEELAFGFGIMNGEAVAKTMTVDYVKCAQVRVIE